MNTICLSYHFGYHFIEFRVLQSNKKSDKQVLVGLFLVRVFITDLQMTVGHIPFVPFLPVIQVKNEI